MLTGVVATDGPTRLVLRGHWASAPTVTGVTSFSWTPAGLTLNLPGGKAAITIG
ncbi:MAG TPA: hypothetical protein VGW79_05590 [Actinomycetota bacterium]|nr:hypothetical protein [Actinomycetota bacterium]